MTEQPDLVLRHNPFLLPGERRLTTRVVVRVASTGEELRIRIRLRLASAVRAVLRLDPPGGSTDEVIRTDRGAEVPLSADWSGTCEYAVGFDLRDGPRGEDLQVAVVDLVRGEPDAPRRTGQVRAVKAHWTTFSGGTGVGRSERDLADAIWAGCAAYEFGDLEGAGLFWEEASRRARRTGDDDSSQRLTRLVAAGRLRPDDVIDAGRPAHAGQDRAG
ncbi:hypothetical protein [Saccharopolyspora pogona]|uniref:hypothetical protein n=1 Tax=Saccharopolyspora pogona TaxID=333966 RepID=UPI001682309A|nr:hypothetical protein [Saccharopolyspora pogona]